MEFEVHAGKGDSRRGTYILNYLDRYYVNSTRLSDILNSGGTERDIARKLGIYTSAGEIAIRKVREMIDGKNTNGIFQLARQIKDASEAIGAVRVGDYAEELEWECNSTQGGRANYKRVEQTMAGLTESWTETRSQFENVVRLINEDAMGQRLDWTENNDKAEAVMAQSKSLLDYDIIEDHSKMRPITANPAKVKGFGVTAKALESFRTLPPLTPILRQATIIQQTKIQAITTKPMVTPSIMTPLTPIKSYSLLDFTGSDSRAEVITTQSPDLLDWSEKTFKQAVITQSYNLVDL